VGPCPADCRLTLLMMVCCLQVLATYVWHTIFSDLILTWALWICLAGAVLPSGAGHLCMAGLIHLKGNTSECTSHCGNLDFFLQVLATYGGHPGRRGLSSAGLIHHAGEGGDMATSESKGDCHQGCQCIGLTAGFTGVFTIPQEGNL
jgi:hypothetical protein